MLLTALSRWVVMRYVFCYLWFETLMLRSTLFHRQLLVESMCFSNDCLMLCTIKVLPIPRSWQCRACLLSRRFNFPPPQTEFCELKRRKRCL